MNFRAEGDIDYFASSYSTLAVAVITLVTSAGIYYALFREHYDPTWFQQFVSVLFCVICGALLLLSVLLHEGRVFGVRFLQKDSPFRGSFLPPAAILLLLAVAALCSLTGGSVESPFSHYLTATGGLSIVFARELRNRLILGGFTIIAYVLAGKFHFTPRTQLDADTHLVFSTFCAAVIGALAIVAISGQVPTIPDASPTSGSSHIS